jgi:plasmid stabilization system protein ParE
VRRPRFVLTPQARADLVDIWNYITEDSLESADRVLERLHAAFTRLAEMPGMGHHREDLADARHRSLDALLIPHRLPRPDQAAHIRFTWSDGNAENVEITKHYR